MSSKESSNKKREVPQHAWEDVSTSDAKWSNVEEDEHGNIVTSDGGINVPQEDLIRQRKKRLEQQDYAKSKKRVVRDLMRYMYLVLDGSHWMRGSTGASAKATYLDMVWQMAADFIDNFYDVNPLSHLGIIVCSNGEAEMLSPLSIHSTLHLTRLASSLQSCRGEGGGEFSLQNGLEVAGRSLGYVPSYASREIVVVCAALNTCDPGNALVDTLPKLMKANIRMSCLALQAELNICRTIATETHGVMSVCQQTTTTTHLHDLWMQQCIPPPSHKNGSEKYCQMVSMGFPIQSREDDVPCWIHTNHPNVSLLSRSSYHCPRCKARVQSVPTDCQVCGLALILAPHLARSHHHLFPQPPFIDLPPHIQLSTTTADNSITPIVASSSQLLPNTTSTSIPMVSSSNNNNNNNNDVVVEMDATLVTSYEDCDRCCFACLKWIGLQPTNSNKHDSPEILRFQCPNCKNIFCADCDAFLHESLHNCPGCLSI